MEAFCRKKDRAWELLEKEKKALFFGSGYLLLGVGIGKV